MRPRAAWMATSLRAICRACRIAGRVPPEDQSGNFERSVADRLQQRQALRVRDDALARLTFGQG
jgi:hypothetical protein